MAFDKDAYVELYLKPRSRRKVLALEDDLFERYAIRDGAGDTEIAETIRAVRACWNSQQQAGSKLQRYTQLCRADDERLKGRRREDMMTAAWWKAERKAQKDVAGERVGKLSGLLAAAYGAFGVVTRSVLVRSAERVSLDPAQARQAAEGAGLEVVDDVEIPDDPPIAQYSTLETEMGVAGASSVVDLIHPNSGPFRMVDRFESLGGPALRLDVEAVENQALEAEKKPQGSSIWGARRAALAILRSAARSGADLRLVALYHLTRAAASGAIPGAAGIKSELTDRGLDERDASVLAIALADPAGSAPVSTEARIERLLQEGRLREAEALSQGLPSDGSANTKDLAARVDAARARCNALLDVARALLATTDEVGAAAKVSEAALISADDGDEMMATVPLAPPRDLRIGSDGDKARLHWQPNAGHTDQTAYQVVRSGDGPPMSPASGTLLATVAGTLATDEAAPVARPVHYGVFATAPGRPASRPAVAEHLLVPPVLNARCEVGPVRVTAHWSTHPGVHHVDAVRRDAGVPTPIPVEHGSATLDGLPEGVTVQIELTAVYETPKGAMLRSAPVAVSGAPRAVAKPLEGLRADPVADPEGVRVRVSWVPVDRSDVRIKRGAAPPRWGLGATITAEEMTLWGTDVTGSTESSSGRMRLEAALPAGVHHLVPFSVGATGIVVGRAVPVAVTDPVGDLSFTSFDGFARLAWTWPAMSELAEVIWERDDPDEDAVGLEKVSRHAYDRGVTVPLGAGPCRVAVRALVLVNGRAFGSPPATLTIPGRGRARVEYHVRSSPSMGPFGGRTKVITVTARDGSPPIRLVMVATCGDILPTEASDGRTILDETFRPGSGGEARFTARVPYGIRRPRWVRCFLLSGDAELVDPPLGTLKEG